MSTMADEGGRRREQSGVDDDDDNNMPSHAQQLPSPPHDYPNHRPKFIPPRRNSTDSWEEGPMPENLSLPMPQRRRSLSGGSRHSSHSAHSRGSASRNPHLYGMLQREDSADSRSGFPGRSVSSASANPFRPVPAAVARISNSAGSFVVDPSSSSLTSATAAAGAGAEIGIGAASVGGGTRGVAVGRRGGGYPTQPRRSSTGNRRSSLDNDNRRASMESQASTASMSMAQVEHLTKAERAAEVAMSNWKASRRMSDRRKSVTSKIFDDPDTVMGYASVPIIEMDRLPRGGLSFETKAVGRIQFGIPPETIKDSMRLGIGVPNVYIVPVERFCREMGPALGINVAEFEFPAYFNYFVHQKQCTLVVDSEDAEDNIRRVFGETLLGPAQFRNHNRPKANEEEDFDPSFAREARPNFYKEFNWFRTNEATENYDELCLDMLVKFTHFSPKNMRSRTHDTLGVPPPPPESANNFFDCFNESDNVSSGVASGYQESRGSLHHDSSLRSTSKRYKEVLHEKQVGRRHTTFLEGSDNEEEEESVETDHKSLSHVSYRSADIGADTQRGLRPRAMSDPDLRRKANDSSSTSDNMFAAAAAAAVEESSRLLRTSSQRRINNNESGTTKSAAAGNASDDRDGFSFASGPSLLDTDEEENQKQKRQSWMYSQAKWLGDVATLYPHSASDEQKQSKNCARVEIFKMTGGTEYIVHDIDENNTIVGKIRFSGTVRVPDEIAVEGFSSNDAEDLFLEDDEDDGHEIDGNNGDVVQSKEMGRESDIKSIRLSISTPVSPPTFHPPSFGVTVLGNSHGFDKNGSTSGYVLWINGRGVMIDPPPYSSAALEREGIRPRMIMAIIITHCHADHDAGAFQKVMTGTKVAVITTPTIYKSFIRKYSALSGLSPALLRHSHRHRPAIIGQPLKFQGATFHFTYTLHTIPCIAFRVEWRGRSMVFTGDHMNIPEKIDDLERTGVLTKERADSIRQLPLIECDLLLHESGAPPIHTPLEVLLNLPDEVKKRLYVVHTSALPKECELRVAPIGTTDTIRLDGVQQNQPAVNGAAGNTVIGGEEFVKSLDDGGYPNLTISGDFVAPIPPQNAMTSGRKKVPPLVLSRPTCVSDAWFILNLLSAVPFLSSLSYSNTMEVLEIARVEVYCAGEVVLPAHRRSEALCVVWEGTCIERESPKALYGRGTTGNKEGASDLIVGWPSAHEEEDDNDENSKLRDSSIAESTPGDSFSEEERPAAVWHAGDWTGPKSLQPEASLSGEATYRGVPQDVVALSSQGVKVILVSMKDLHKILKGGSPLYRKYLECLKKEEKEATENSLIDGDDLSGDDIASQWGLASSTKQSEKKVVSPKPPNGSSFLDTISHNSALGNLSALQKRHLESLAEGPRYFDAGQPIWQVGSPVEYAFLIVSGSATFAQPPRKRGMNRRCSTGSMRMPVRSLTMGATPLGMAPAADRLINVSPNSEFSRMEIALQMRAEEIENEMLAHKATLLPREERSRSARDRFINKVLARLNARHAYTSGIIFSRGHFLSDTSRMVSGSLAYIQGKAGNEMDESSCELRGEHHYHSSTIVASEEGCVVMLFQRESLIAFFDAHPGVLLSLLGTQAVV